MRGPWMGSSSVRAHCSGHLDRPEKAGAVPGGLAPAAPPELRWLGLLRDRRLQAILDEGLALARGDAEST